MNIQKFVLATLLSILSVFISSVDAAEKLSLVGVQSQPPSLKLKIEGVVGSPYLILQSPNTTGPWSAYGTPFFMKQNTNGGVTNILVPISKTVASAFYRVIPAEKTTNTFSGTPGTRYAIFQTADLSGPWVQYSSPFILLGSTTNIVVPISRQYGQGFFTMASVDPTFTKVDIKTNGLIDSLFMVIAVKAPPLTGVSLDSLPVTAYSVNPNNPNSPSYVAWLAAYSYKDAACKIPDYTWVPAAGSVTNQLSDAISAITNGGPARVLHFEVNHQQHILRVPAGETRYIGLCGAGNYSSGTYKLSIPNSMDLTTITNLEPQYLVNGAMVWSPATNSVHTDVAWANGKGLIDTNKLTNTRSY